VYTAAFASYAAINDIDNEITVNLNLLSALVFNYLVGHIGENAAEYLQLSQQLNHRIAIPVALLTVFDSVFNQPRPVRRGAGRLCAQ
jgi:hypothetical protein